MCSTDSGSTRDTVVLDTATIRRCCSRLSTDVTCSSAGADSTKSQLTSISRADSTNRQLTISRADSTKWQLGGRSRMTTRWRKVEGRDVSGGGDEEEEEDDDEDEEEKD